MIFVTRIVEKDVRLKIDVDFIEKALPGMNGEEVAIIYVCVNDDWRKDDSWKKKGTKYYRIVLPYEQVKKMPPDEVRALMLQLAKERLSVPKKKTALAAA